MHGGRRPFAVMSALLEQTPGAGMRLRCCRIGVAIVLHSAYNHR
jgi:hypothetical protein